MAYVTVKPIDWPQDQLEVPHGFGGMPPVEFGNEHQIGREWFSLTADFTYIQNTAAFTPQTQILLTPQDGDFWCDSIGAVSWLADTTTVGITKDLQKFLTGMLTVSDIRSGRNLFYGPAPVPTNHATGPVFPPNSAPINLFRKLPQSGEESAGTYFGDTPLPNGFRVTQTLMQPICFTRQGGIQITFTSLDAVPAGDTFNISVGFNGWKEYEHAST